LPHQIDESSVTSCENLLLGAENMGVVLRKATHTHDAVQGAGRLIAVAGAKFGHNAAAGHDKNLMPMVEYLHVARTVHWLYRVVTFSSALVVNMCSCVILPMAGFSPTGRGAFQNLRRSALLDSH
jgi:hypothetical protein